MIAYNNLVKEVEMNFEEFCNSTEFEKKSEVRKQGVSESQEKELQQKFDKYKNMNSDMLMSELIRETNRQKTNGTYNPQGLNEMVSKLKPMLSDAQKQRLDEILKMLR